MVVDLESVPAPTKKKIRRYLLLLLFMGLAVYFFLPQLTAMQYALQVVSTLRVPFVLLAVGAQALSYLGSGYLLRSVVNPGSRTVSLIDGALVTAGANSVGTLGGGVLGTAGMTYLFLRRRGVNRGVAGLCSWFPIYLNDTVLALLSLAGLLILTFLKKSSGLLAAGFTFVSLTLGAAIGLLVWCLSHREKLPSIAIALAGFFAKFRRKPLDHSRIETTVRHLLEGWDALVLGGWHGPVLGAVLNTGFDMLTLRFLFLAAGLHVNPAVLVAGYGVPQLLGKLTVILGGIGVVESGMAGLYTIMGVPKTGAIVVVLGYRLLSFWLPTLIGVVLVPYLGRSGSTPTQTESPGSGRNSVPSEGRPRR
jgi:uncharacterized protein (TIRG00374 family)